MMKLMRKQLSNQRGVTLIELLAVIVILGILAAVAVPVVLNQIDDADDKADAANLAIINDAIERYAVINGEYPEQKNTDIDTFDELLAELKSSTDNGGPFLKDFPSDPENGEWSYNETNHLVEIE